MIVKRHVRYYLDVDTRKVQDCLMNATTLKSIICYITKGYFSAKALNNITKQRMKLIYDYISIYCSVINSPEGLDMIKQVDKFSSVLCDN